MPDSMRGFSYTLTSTRAGITFKHCRELSELVGEDFSLKDEYKLCYGLNCVPLKDKKKVEILTPSTS